MLLLVAAAACADGRGFADAGVLDGGAQDGGGGLVWRNAAALPSPRQEVAAAVLRGALYVVGGLDGRGRGLRETLRLDVGANAWTRLADYPFAVDHALAITIGDRVYVMGGSEGFNPANPEKRVYAYDADTDRWTPRADMPDARWAPAGAAVNEIAYVGGGLGQRAAAIMAYDTTRDTWSTLQGVALTPRDHLGAAEVDGRVVFVGGRQGVTNLALVEVLDPGRMSIVTGAPMPTARGGIAASALAGRVFVAGGENLTNPLDLPGGVYPQLELYDVARDLWSAGPPMKTPRHGHGAVTLGGLVFTIGGGDRAGVGAVSTVETVGP